MKVTWPWSYERVQDDNTVILVVYFARKEFRKIQQYDKERRGDDERIIMEIDELNGNTIINVNNLKNAVESNIITKLEIKLYMNEHDHFESPALDLMENYGFKSLRITTSQDFTLETLHAEDIIKLINRYKVTLDQFECHFRKVDMAAFSKVYEVGENWTINTPLDASLTAGKDKFNKRYKSVPEYNDMQETLRFIMECQGFQGSFKKTIEKNQREELCAAIIERNPKFTKMFSKCEPSKIKKVMGDESIYNTFLGYYIDYSTTLNLISEWYTREKEKYLPYDTKERIVEHIGGVGVITEIDNALENNNLTTSGTTKDYNCCLIM